MPKGIFGRAIIIIVAPMVLLQTIMTAVFIERHLRNVTFNMSEGLVREIAVIVEMVETGAKKTEIQNIAKEQLKLDVKIEPNAQLPAKLEKPFFPILEDALENRIKAQIKKPFWVDVATQDKIGEIFVKTKDNVVKVKFRKARAEADNWHIFLVWMVLSSIVLLAIAVMFLRNQISPIVELSKAAEMFGKGQETPNLKPKGAMEVRNATASFFEMKDRIARSLEQRTAMLSGVSHDLRTVLTRFRLQLALVPESKETKAMGEDVKAMHDMLEAYLEFARGDGDENQGEVDLAQMIGKFKGDAERKGCEMEVSAKGATVINARETAMYRLFSNLIGNAVEVASEMEVRLRRYQKFLMVEVHDNGTGIEKDKREEAFKPFVRLDDARNLNDSGTGLGLAIARDIARSHGGEIELDDSDMGGLCVRVRLPA